MTFRMFMVLWVILELDRHSPLQILSEKGRPRSHTSTSWISYSTKEKQIIFFAIVWGPPEQLMGPLGTEH